MLDVSYYLRYILRISERVSPSPLFFNCMFPTATLIIFANEPALKQKLWNRNITPTSSNEPASKKRLAKILTAPVCRFVISADDRRIIKCNVDINWYSYKVLIKKFWIGGNIKHYER